MKKRITIISVWMLLFLIRIIGLQAQEIIPPYHQHAFLMTSPGAFGEGLLGFENPAMVNTIHGPDLRFFFSDASKSILSPNHWGTFAGLRHLSFGMIRREFKSINSDSLTTRVRISDYRLSIGGGNRMWSYGVGYGWSGGNKDIVGRQNIWLAGLLCRPSPHFSAGLSGKFARNGNREGVFDLAIRPLANSTLTLFGDLVWHSRDHIEERYWSVGAAVSPLGGLHVTARYFNSEAFTLGLSVALGSPVISAQTHFNHNQKVSHTTYGVRLGAPKKNFIDSHLKNGSGYMYAHLKGSVGYQKYRFFDEGRLTLKSIIDGLEGARTDPRIAGVALNLSGFNCSRVMAWEIRQQLLDLKKSGKNVIICLDRGSMNLYHIASVANTIVMDPEGLLIIQGYVLGRTYLKGTMAKLGLGFEEWRFFDYKTASETFARSDMSDKDREQLQAFVDNQYELVREDVCNSREFPHSEYDALVDSQAVFVATKALEVGLVDTLARWHQVAGIIADLEGSAKTRIPSSHLADRIFPEEKWGPRPQIAVVYALGDCDLDRGIQARRLEKIIDGLRSNRAVKAVVLRVDSPGGDGLASDLVAEAMKRCKEKKPVIISQGSVAASGGYWLSMYGDSIVAAPNTLTGSIGVIGGWVWNKDFGDKSGMSWDHVKRGRFGDIGRGITIPYFGLSLPERNLTKTEFGLMKQTILSMYDDFVRKVADGRQMNLADVKPLAQGRVWSGKAAVENGLVDQLGGLKTALAIARESSGIDPDEDVEIVEYPILGWFNPNLLSPRLFGLELNPNLADPVSRYIGMIARYPGQPLAMTPLEAWNEGFSIPKNE